MFSRTLSLLSVVCSLVVMVSFAAFAIDEARSGSESSQAGITGARETVSTEVPATVRPTPAQERAREAAHSGARELLDDGNDILLAPFASIVDDGSGAWAQRSIPALIGLFLYGFGLGFLARFAAGRA